MSEYLDQQYHARDLQVKAIFLDANNSFNLEMIDHEYAFLILNGLLTTPQILQDHLIRESGLTKETLFDRAFEATKTTARRNIVLSVFQELYRYCEELSRMEAEIGIDTLATDIPVAFTMVFNNQSERFSQVATEAREEGISIVLATLEGDKPLMRYRRDLAKSFGLSTAINGEVAMVSTKIPNVDLKLWYPGQDRNPKLSLLVHRFTDLSF